MIAGSVRPKIVMSGTTDGRKTWRKSTLVGLAPLAFAVRT